MAYYTRTYNPQPTTRVASTDLKNEFQAVENGLASAEAADGKAIRAPEATTALPSAASRALKVLSFDGSGNPRTTIAETDLAAAVTAASNAATSESNAAFSETAAAASAIAADASADAAAASAASIADGPVVSVNGLTGVVSLSASDVGAQETLVSGTSIKTINSASLLGSGDISTATRTPVWTAITATGTYTVPSGVSSIRAYAVGKGGNGGADTSATNTCGGGGGGMAYGDIAVTAGQTVNVTISAGVATLAIGGTTYLTANPGGNGGATAGTAGTASKHASVTNGGAYSGGAGASEGGGGGGSAGSPLGAGYAGSPSTGGGGAGIGGAGGSGGSGSGGGGAGGAGSQYHGGGAGGAASGGLAGSGRGRVSLFTDLLLADMTSPGGKGYGMGLIYPLSAPGKGGGGGGCYISSGQVLLGGHGGDGGGGGGAYGGGSEYDNKGGDGGLLGGGGGCYVIGSTYNFHGYGGNGGNGGGGGGCYAPSGKFTAGTGGAAIVLIYA